jgi:DNA-binding transcriptional LysR family regulator
MVEMAHACSKITARKASLPQTQRALAMKSLRAGPSTAVPRAALAGGARRPINQRVLQELALRYFMEVANAGSITEAAARLEVAPSAVSRQIGRLERELDTLLFERRARGMTLNSAGEVLVAHARRAWLDIERVSDEILALRGLRQGEVRLAATEGFAYDFLPGLVAEFQARSPGIRFSVDMCVQGEVARRVREGVVDLGVTVSLASERGLNVEIRHPSPILAVVAPGHPLAAKRQVSLVQVVAHPLALPARASTLRQLLDISCSRQGLVLDAVLTSDHLYPLIQYVTRTQAVTFCGEIALRQHLRSGAVVAIALRDREMNERHFEVQSMAGRHLPDAARAFLAHLRETLLRDF